MATLAPDYLDGLKHATDSFYEVYEEQRVQLEEQQASLIEREELISRQHEQLLEAISKLSLASEANQKATRKTCETLMSRIAMSLKELQDSAPLVGSSPTNDPRPLAPSNLTPEKVDVSSSQANTPHSHKDSPKYKEGPIDGIDATAIPSAVEELSDSEVGSPAGKERKKFGIEAYPDFKPLSKEDTITSFFTQGPTADVRKHLIEAEHSKNLKDGIETVFKISDKEQQPFFDRAVHLLVSNQYVSLEQLEAGVSGGELTADDIMQMADKAEAELNGEQQADHSANTSAEHEEDATSEEEEEARPPARHGDISPTKSIPSPNTSGRIGGTAVTTGPPFTASHLNYSDDDEEDHAVNRLVVEEGEEEEVGEEELEHEAVGEGMGVDSPHDNYSSEDDDEFEDPAENLPDNQRASQPQPRHHDPLRAYNDSSSEDEDPAPKPHFDLNLHNVAAQGNGGDGTPPLARGGSRPSDWYQPNPAQQLGFEDDDGSSSQDDDDEEIDLPVDNKAPVTTAPAKGKMVYSNFDSDSD